MTMGRRAVDCCETNGGRGLNDVLKARRSNTTVNKAEGTQIPHSTVKGKRRQCYCNNGRQCRRRAVKAAKGLPTRGSGRGGVGNVSKGQYCKNKTKTVRKTKADEKLEGIEPTAVASQAQRRPVKQGLLAKGKAAK